MKLLNKVAIITGAGSGIARASALLFSKEGAAIVVADQNNKAGLETKEMIEKEGGKAIFIRTDVSDASQVEQMVQSAIDAFGKIDVLFNCAAVHNMGSVHEVKDEDWDFLMDVNLKGTYLCCKQVVPHMLKAGSGSIINVASVAGGCGALPRQTAYCVSKAGVAMMTKVMALDYAGKGIKVNCIAPGPTDTPMMSPVGRRPGFVQSVIDDIPLGRLGKPQELAQVALFLASDDSSFVHGHVLVTDGGQTVER
ncbi:MAG: SDR family oxidoreductase [Anaerolineales bacterium]|nr:SDR family oxidoreductase [Anaerolineales bacterium]